MGNIVGEPFKDYVKEQINHRQEIHGKKNRTPKDINYLNSKTSWIKLASGTKIEMERLNMLPGLSETQKKSLKGLGLAKSFTLFNGTTRIGTGTDTAAKEQLNFSTKDQNALDKARKIKNNVAKTEDIYYNSSFTSTQKQGFLGSEGAYFSGIGNNKYEFGIVPMPGIVSVDVKALERGSIRKATITLKAYNKEQFDIIDILYLRLGYTLLLEWGDSHYVNNKDGKIEALGTTLIEREFFRGGFNGFADTYYNLLNTLEEERKKYSGCYDGLIGKISNFKWTFNDDGTYNIILDVISLGDVIESLKLNVAPYSKPSNEAALTSAEENLIDSRREDNELAKMFYNIKTSGIRRTTKSKTVEKAVISGAVVAATSPGLSNLLGIQRIVTTALSLLNYFNIGEEGINTAGSPGGITLSTKNTEENKYFDKIQIGRGIIIPEQYQILYNNIIDKGDKLDKEDTCEYVQLGTENKKFQWYIRFGNLLEAINHLLVHNFKTSTGVDYSSLHIDTNSITNLMYYMPNMISLDPKICILKNEIVKPEGFTDEMFEGLNSFRLDSKNGKFSYGKIMNIYLNMNYVLELLFKTDKEGNILFMEFLRNICDGINRSLGSVNRLEPKISPDNNILKIYDQTPMPGKSALPPEIFPTSSVDSTFELYGINKINSSSNFVHNVGLTTEVTPEYASMITVGATADGYVVGEESTAFSKWNIGIVDRFKESIGFADNISVKNSIEEKYDRIKINYLKLMRITSKPSEVNNWYSYSGINFNEELKLGYTNSSSEQRIQTHKNKSNNFGLVSTKINTENISANISIVKEYYKYIQAVAVQTQSTTTFEDEQGNSFTTDPGGNSTIIIANNKLASSGQTGFLPFNLQLDMDGISGMKLYQKLEVNSKFLPTNYPEKLEFITTNIDHNLRNNKWVTRINTIATVSNLISGQQLAKTLKNNMNQYLEELRNEGKIDDKFTIVVKDYSTVIPPSSSTLNPIIVSSSSQVSKYMKLYGPNSTKKKLPVGFDAIEGKYYKNFIIRKGNGKNSYAMQFIKYLDGRDSRIKIKDASSSNPGQLGNGADISKRLYKTLIVLAENALKENINLVITAGNDKFHQGKTLSPSAKYPKSNVTPANTTHTRGLAIDVRAAGLSTEEINIRIKLLKKSGFGGILYHDPPHIHANINPNLPTQDR
tara:strand:+ start:5493 stop:9008 length:3516 start_codon:yes stop_codon:yes gene_type:complete